MLYFPTQSYQPKRIRQGRSPLRYDSLALILSWSIFVVYGKQSEKNKYICSSKRHSALHTFWGYYLRKWRLKPIIRKKNYFLWILLIVKSHILRMLHEVPFSHIWSKCAETLHEGWDARRWGWGRRERTHVRDQARIPKATKQIAFVQQSLFWCGFVCDRHHRTENLHQGLRIRKVLPYDL